MAKCRDGEGKVCSEPATVRLLAPDGKGVPGSRMCRKHAHECIDEYREKLGEVWTVARLPKLF